MTAFLGKCPKSLISVPLQLQKQVRESFEDTIPTGIDYGTITVKVVIHYLRSLHYVQKRVTETEEGLTSLSSAQV